MGAPRVFFLLLCGIFIEMVQSEIDLSSVLSNLDSNMASLKQKVLGLENKMSSVENFISSIPQTLQEANEQVLITALDEIEIKLENYASANKVSEMVEALRKDIDRTVKTELLMLLANLTLRVEELEERGALREDVMQMNQSLRNQTLLMNKFISQMEDFQSAVTCADDPPTPRFGRPMNFKRRHGSDVRYQCDRNFFLTGNSTVRCNLGKWEGQPPLCRFFDATFTLRAQWNRELYISNVTCSSEEGDQKIQFSRVLANGSGGALPGGAKTHSRDKAVVFDLRDVERHDRYGVYECSYEKDGTRTGVSFSIRDTQTGGIWFTPPVTASIGDIVELQTGWFHDPRLKWLHNSTRIPARDGRGYVNIVNVSAADAGIYKMYLDGDADYRILKLLVRGCKANMLSEHCDQECPPCYNGGTCHVLLGMCVCPLGFEGSNCEFAFGEIRLGANGSESCYGKYCAGSYYCKPDPYGCSCAPGYWGYQCANKCGSLFYGASCKQVCNCAAGSCDRHTGACSGGCPSGWTGQSCRIPAGN